MADEEGVNPRDEGELREAVSSIGEEQIWRTLEELAKRELLLLGHPTVKEDQEMRQAALWNAAALIAAAERLAAIPTRDRTGRSTEETGRR